MIKSNFSGNYSTTFRLRFNYISTSFWLFFDIFSTTLQQFFDCFSSTFLLRFNYISTAFRPLFDHFSTIRIESVSHILSSIWSSSHAKKIESYCTLLFVYCTTSDTSLHSAAEKLKAVSIIGTWLEKSWFILFQRWQKWKKVLL